jgi:hypothetical protein
MSESMQLSLITQPAAQPTRAAQFLLLLNFSYPISAERKIKKKVLLIARAVLAFGAAGRDSLINQAACFYLLTCSPTLTLFLISPRAIRYACSVVQDVNKTCSQFAV